MCWRPSGLGPARFYIARTHLLRSMLPILIVNATFMVADLILALSGLSFLGLGIQPPHASWGGLLNDGLQLVIIGPWWLIVFPGVAIFLAIVAMNVLGQRAPRPSGGVANMAEKALHRSHIPAAAKAICAVIVCKIFRTRPMPRPAVVYRSVTSP
ncbi:hypothetical protein RIE95_17860 [Acidithiobacillus thiooxidans]|uniref:ABC transporter permease subunit n=1 Tax=Acidithiobacillus thiooxidans TaxID=930 RepID=UPI0028572C8F|nr:ABC transporter permease subunit [Acidithiobacillus thiooxidans]MDR7928827.1 hypothetical protein [Acidithiobacillus thiooxidans]